MSILGALALLAFDAPPARAGDDVPPAAVADLVFASADAPDLHFEPETGTLAGAPLVFTWTAPGDDGETGQAWRYDIRLVRGRLDESTWTWAQPLAEPIDLPLPSPAGQMDVLALTEFSGLAPGVHYEIGMKAVDEAGNIGPLSSVVEFETPGESETWSETVNIGQMELWAWGRKIAGPEVECRYENSALLINGHARPFVPEELPRSPDYTKYETVPAVRELLDQGVILDEAALRYLRERRAFLAEMSALGREQGTDVVTAELESSALVDSVMMVGRLGGYLLLRGETLRAEFLWDDEEPGLPAFHYQAVSTHPDQARAAVDWLRRSAEAAGDSPRVALLARGGMMVLSGRRDLNAFRSQVAHLERAGRLEKLPQGPLSEGLAREFLETARHIDR
jgi:hypothetical protein